jgi:HlyD family secretion protein
MRRIFLILLAFCLLLAFVMVYHYFKQHQHDHELILYGNVDVRQVEIGFRVPGRVEALYFEEGDRVCTGSLMARLDRSPYESQVKQAEASVEANRSTLKNAEKILKRRRELIEVEGISKEDLENAENTHNTSKANLAAAEASLAISQDNLSYTEVYAPTDGIILTRIREPGTVVNASDPVYTLSVSRPVWIRAYVNEPNLGRVQYGMKADVYTDTYGAPILEGRVGFISPVAEFTPKTVQTTDLRTDLVYRLRIYVDDPEGFLKQGMPVTVKLRINRE